MTTANIELNESLQAYIDQAVTCQLEQAMATWRAEKPVLSSSTAEPKELANRATLVVFSGDMDKLMAAFVIASGAASMGMEVSVFFTFWGLTALKKCTHYRGKGWAEKMMGAMLPCGVDQVGPSRMNMWGAGRVLFKRMMKQKKVQSLTELLDVLQDMEVRLVACQMSMDVMGIQSHELIENLEFGGVATYLADARDSRVTLFI